MMSNKKLWISLANKTEWMYTNHMKISRAHRAHLKKIALSGGLAVKKKMPEGYYKKIARKGWRLRRKRLAMV